MIILGELEFSMERSWISGVSLPGMLFLLASSFLPPAAVPSTDFLRAFAARFTLVTSTEACIFDLEVFVKDRELACLARVRLTPVPGVTAPLVFLRILRDWFVVWASILGFSFEDNFAAKLFK